MDQATNRLDRRPFYLATLALGVLLASLAAPAVADVLVTLDGRLIETRGAWTIEGESIAYTDGAGAARQIALAEVDLEASREMTAERLGATYKPPVVRAEPERRAAVASASDRQPEPKFDVTDRPPIILYETSWCGYCRKARRLLKQLDAEFEARDVERDPQAAAEARRKAGGGGIPVLDFGGVVVRGYSDRTIRNLVRSMRQQGVLPEAR